MKESEMLDIERQGRIRLGFVWAIFCAILWGSGYVVMSAEWQCFPFSDSGEYIADDTVSTLFSGAVVSACQGLMFVIVLFLIWTSVNRKQKDVVRTISKPKISKWFLLGAVLGGPIAIYGNMLATTYVGATYSSTIALLYGAIGAIIAHFMYKEHYSVKAAIGITVVIAGGILIVDPANMIDEISSDASREGMWIGYLGGIISAFGWALEANFAARGLDVTDADSGLIVRYIWEVLLWFLILIPIGILICGEDSFSMVVDALTSGQFLFWIMLAALSLGMCYIAEYKAIPLIGVGRTLSVASMYAIMSIIFLSTLCGAEISAFVAVGAVTAVIGTFMIYWEGSKSLESGTRDAGGAE